ELLLGSSAVAFFAVVGAASAQQTSGQAPAAPGATSSAQTTVTPPKLTPSWPAPRPVVTRAAPAAPAPTPTPEQVQAEANRQVVQRTQRLDQRRDDVLQPKVGTNISTVIPDNVPQGSNIAISDLVYQLPGVSQDSTSAGDF